MLWIMPWVNCTPFNCDAGPFHAGVGRAFAEIHVVLAREPLDILVGKDQGLVDQAIDHQAIIFLAKLNRPRMVPLERTALRRDRPIQRMDRREVDRRNRRSGQPLDIAAHHMAFIADRHAVRRLVHPGPGVTRPILQFGDQRIGSVLSARLPGSQTSGDSCTTFQQRTACCLTHLVALLFGNGKCAFFRHDFCAEIDLFHQTTTSTELFGSSVTVPCFAIWLSTTSQICGPSVPSFTLAQPATT